MRSDIPKLATRAMINALEAMLSEAARCTCVDGDAQQIHVEALAVYENASGRRHEQRRVIRGEVAYGEPGSEVSPT